MKNTVMFWGEKNKMTGYLSNFYPSPFKMNDILFVCSEQAFMYQKAVHFNDKEIANEILRESNPHKIKSLGRKVRNFNQNDWDKVKYEYMLNAVKMKFMQNDDIKAKLLATGNKELIEASPYDKIWGIGMAYNDPNIENREMWGENLLGKVLMEVREIIKNSK